MTMDTTERERLGEALSAVREGDYRRFEDLLWLGFGDAWTRVGMMLVEKGYMVRRGDGDADLTSSGCELLDRLTNPMSKAG